MILKIYQNTNTVLRIPVETTKRHIYGQNHNYPILEHNTSTDLNVFIFCEPMDDERSELYQQSVIARQSGS